MSYFLWSLPGVKGLKNPYTNTEEFNPFPQLEKDWSKDIADKIHLIAPSILKTFTIIIKYTPIVPNSTWLEIEPKRYLHRLVYSRVYIVGSTSNLYFHIYFYRPDQS